MLAVSFGAVRFLVKHSEWSFQSVCEIARLRQRASYDLLAMLQQRIEIVDERLHFVRVGSSDSASGAIA